jgi:phage tail sheath protein FI
MAPPESVDINVFAAPDVNYKDNLLAVNYALDMVENRADSIYIIESPRLSTDTTKATATQASEAIEESGIDSSYAATYWPWIQIEDPTSNKFIYISPTAEVVKNIALTDNIAYSWYAPAGLNRGQVNCIRADVQLSRDDRDTLYDANINPINTVAQQGVTIQGQKTLQI